MFVVQLFGTKCSPPALAVGRRSASLSIKVVRAALACLPASSSARPPAQGRAKGVWKGVGKLKEWESGFEQSVHVCVCLCVWWGGLEPNVIAYSTSITSCEKGHQWLAALELLRQVQRRSLELNVITYNSLVSSRGKGQLWLVVLELLRQMQQRRLEPDVITLQFMHQFMRAGPAVACSSGAPSADAAEEARAGCDHLQFVHQFMREGPAVACSSGAASEDAAEEAGAERDHFQFVNRMQGGPAVARCAGAPSADAAEEVRTRLKSL